MLLGGGVSFYLFRTTDTIAQKVSHSMLWLKEKGRALRSLPAPGELFSQKHPAVNEKTARTIKKVVTLHEGSSITYEILSHFRFKGFL